MICTVVAVAENNYHLFKYACHEVLLVSYVLCVTLVLFVLMEKRVDSTG